MADSRKVDVVINSIINGEKIVIKSIGEYRLSDGNHIIVFNHNDQNYVTKYAIKASKENMLLKRLGAIKGDMLFDISKQTETRYETMGLSHDFIINTNSYFIKEDNNSIVIETEYLLSDKSPLEPIKTNQTITINCRD